MQLPPFLKFGDILIPTKDILDLDISDIERQSVTARYLQNGKPETAEARGFDAIDAVMALRPSALEGRRMKWRKGAWAVHNLIGHPCMEILARLHFYKAALRIHDATVPAPRDFHPGVSAKAGPVVYAQSGFGSSLTSSVLSAFDQNILERISEGDVVYDVGAGEGALAQACVQKGARVHAIDLHAPPENFLNNKDKNLIWHQMDLRDVGRDSSRWEKADILIFRRVLYYFPYDEAKSILQNFKPLLKDNGSSFCSLISMHSPYAQTGYTDVPIKKRFEKAVNGHAVQYNLLQPVCMYTQEEAKALFEEAGLKVTDSSHSKWSVYITAKSLSVN